MTQPVVPPPAAPAGKDNTTLFGVLGIIFALCCPLVGVIFGVLSQQQAKKNGKPATLAIVAYVIAAVVFVGGLIYRVSAS